MRKVYFDHISTTAVDRRVLEAMEPYFFNKFGNPSSHFYEQGRLAIDAVTKARERLADLVNASPKEIIFTSGATESNNLAVQGIAMANKDRGRHIIFSEIEHYSILNQERRLKEMGFEITLVPVDSYGIVDPERVERAIRDDTILISIMHANNEIGTIQPISEIAKIAKHKGVIFHTDAVATVGIIPVDVNALNVDAMTISAHSFYGPKGVGALYLKKGVMMKSLFDGGFQEMGYRPGTENVPGIVGLGEAARIAKEEMDVNISRLIPLRDKLMKGLKERIEYLNITGHPTNRLPGHVSFWIEFVEGESLLLWLSMHGISSASGSACSSNIIGKDEKDLRASHVLTAIGVPPEICHGSITFSMGKENTEEDVDYVLEVMPGIVKKLWEMSPLYADRKKAEMRKIS